MLAVKYCFVNSVIIQFFLPIFAPTAFYEEEASSKAEKLQQIEKEIELQKKSTAGMSKKVAELHQHTQKKQQSSSEQYSQEVLEWQKLAKKEKSVQMAHNVARHGQQHTLVATVSLFCLLVLFEWTPSQRKEVGIPSGMLPHVRQE